MNCASQKWISRKEIASITGFSVDRIRRSESHIGLARIRVTVNQRTVVFPREEALAIVKAKLLRPKPSDFLKAFAERLARLKISRLPQLRQVR